MYPVSRLTFLLIILLFLSSCAPTASYYGQLANAVSQQRYLDADTMVDQHKTPYGERNAVLYHMDRAMTQHLLGQYAESNRHLNQARALIDDLYTRSVTLEAGSMLTNDQLLPYEGEDFEKVMIPLLSALNYALQRQWDDALVEARQVDHMLTLLNDRYEKKNIYREDAFARYLSGILYESRGELNDAFIAYRTAFETYQNDYQSNYGTPMPFDLPESLLRLSDALHLTEELEAYRNQFSGRSYEPYTQRSLKGEVVLISWNGWSPEKEDLFLDAPIPDGSGGTYLLRVAFPKFVSRPSRIDHTEVRFRQEGWEQRLPAVIVEDITSIARKNLEDRVGRISAKAIARATTKYLASKQARKKALKEGGESAEALVGFLSNIYTVATEQTDKRSWRTLPGLVVMARTALPPGSYDLEVVAVDAAGGIVGRCDLPGVIVEAGKSTFLSCRIAQ